MFTYTMHDDSRSFKSVYNNLFSTHEASDYLRYDLSCLYLQTLYLPRIGDFIMYPQILLPNPIEKDELIIHYLHHNIRFEVLFVMHNPTALISFGGVKVERNNREFDTIINVLPMRVNSKILLP